MGRPKKKASAKPSKIKKPAKSKITTPAKKVFKIPAKFSSKAAILQAIPKKRVRVSPAYAPLLESLQTRRNEITGQVNHLEKDLREEIADSQDVPGDMADHGSGELSQHLSVTLMENDRVELDRIERAISRIEQGIYGLCEVCEKTIPMTRLKAIPWATRCIGCQSRAEGA